MDLVSEINVYIIILLGIKILDFTDIYDVLHRCNRI